MADYASVGDDDVDLSGDFLDCFGGREGFVDGVWLFGDFDEVDIVVFVGQ